ncbi:MAG: DNA double-strand break repair nuclease NurA [Chloroflexota bacterium]|nr:DNA double-strand break repair nuclease NurA [Chloroflexota bacterium]
MALDLSQIASQVVEAVTKLRQGDRERQEHLRLALETLAETSPQDLKTKIDASKTTWLVSGLGESMAAGHPPPPCPQDFAVAAVDGSHIDVDRHSPVRCYLINLGMVTLRYGKSPQALLASRPTLYTAAEDLALPDPQGPGEAQIEGPLLGVKRAVAEAAALGPLLQALPPELPALALLDGSLILWGLEGREFETSRSFVREEFLDRGFLPALEGIRQQAQGKPRALASYISLPRSTEVANAMRLALCPYEAADCDHCGFGRGERPCDRVAGIQDRQLFEALLGVGERSDTFTSRSSIVRRHYGRHQVRFFYLRGAEEIGRVEFPSWIEERGMVELLHALVLDQCCRGKG